MRLKSVWILSILAALIAFAATLKIMDHAAGGKFSFDFFTIWVLLPYLVITCMAWAWRTEQSLALPWIFLAVVLACGIFSIWAYYSAIYNSTSSSSGIVFIYVPVYLLVGAPLLLLLRRFIAIHSSSNHFKSV
jgi:hypothetical protein